jgi:hypothetical protein
LHSDQLSQSPPCWNCPPMPMKNQTNLFVSFFSPAFSALLCKAVQNRNLCR